MDSSNKMDTCYKVNPFEKSYVDCHKLFKV